MSDELPIPKYCRQVLYVDHALKLRMDPEKENKDELLDFVEHLQEDLNTKAEKVKGVVTPRTDKTVAEKIENGEKVLEHLEELEGEINQLKKGEKTQEEIRSMIEKTEKIYEILNEQKPQYF